jgi:formyltetrahydrofolate deformylase
MALLASRESHCWVDLLHRWHTHERHCEISCMVTNHKQLKQFADWYRVLFHYIDFQPQPKQSAFIAIEQFLTEYQVDLIVLARFMRILPESICVQHTGRIINIHHSFYLRLLGLNPTNKPTIEELN